MPAVMPSIFHISFSKKTDNPELDAILTPSLPRRKELQTPNIDGQKLIMRPSSGESQYRARSGRVKGGKGPMPDIYSNKSSLGVFCSRSFRRSVAKTFKVRGSTGNLVVPDNRYFMVARNLHPPFLAGS